jgi:hypothetical protein
MCRLGWRVVSACRPGFSHAAESVGCQDYQIAKVVDSWLIAAVADGAGSASRAAEGSAAICEGVVDRLSTQIAELREFLAADHRESAIRSLIENAIEQAQERLLLSCCGADEPLQVFSATLVGVVANASAGVFFHIGDGAACTAHSADLSRSIMSPPENGEYPDRTYFFTDESWREHLRLTRFAGEYDLIVLMTDGVTPFALSPGGRGPYIPFLDPVTRYLLSHSSAEGEKALANLLDSERVRPITADDKTFLWAVRNTG